MATNLKEHLMASWSDSMKGLVKVPYLKEQLMANKSDSLKYFELAPNLKDSPRKFLMAQ